MELNIDKMLQEQKKRLEEFHNLPIYREAELKVYHDVGPVVTKTRTLLYQGEIVLVRYISSHTYRVVFPESVKVKDVLAYYDLNDDMFIRCSVRVGCL